MNSLDNYRMRPQYVKRIGNVYPILVEEYENFRFLFYLYLLLDIENIKNRQKQENEAVTQFNSLYDYIVDKILKDTEKLKSKGTITDEVLKMFSGATKEQLEDIMNNNLPLVMECFEKEQAERFVLESRNNICELISITVKNRVIFDDVNMCFLIKDSSDKDIGIINENNFKEYREIVMNQNLLFEPIVSKDKKSQTYLDREFKKNSEEFDLESVVAFVEVQGHKDTTNFTYYRLMSDYCAIVRSMQYQQTCVYIATGCKDDKGNPTKYPNISEHLTIKDNPYSRDKIYKESKMSELDMKLLNNKK